VLLGKGLVREWIPMYTSRRVYPGGLQRG